MSIEIDSVETVNYAIAIQTANGNGFDVSPERVRITGAAIAVSTSIHPDGGMAFTSRDEEELLWSMSEFKFDLPGGIVNHWHGALFDLPFLAERAEVIGVDFGLDVFPIPSAPGSVFLPGHTSAYAGAWRTATEELHVSCDIANDYEDFAGQGVSWSPKSIAQHLGLDTAEPDGILAEATRIRELALLRYRG